MRGRSSPRWHRHFWRYNNIYNERTFLSSNTHDVLRQSFGFDVKNRFKDRSFPGKKERVRLPLTNDKERFDD